MLTETKHQTELAACEEFSITWQTFRNTWVIGRGCPKDCEERLIEIMQNALKQQNIKVNQAIAG